MNKKGILILIIFVMIFSISYALDPNNKDKGGKSGTDDFSDDQKDQLNEQGIDPSSTSPDQVTFNDDGSVTVDEGPVKVGDTTYDGNNIRVDPDGDIQSADTLDVDGNHFENVQDFQRNGEGEYYIGSAERLQDGNRKLLSGKVITGKDDGLDAQQANNIMDENAVVNMVTSYSSSGDSFNLDSANSVYVDGTRFKDIKDSSFKTENGDLVKASVTSAKDNNT